MAGDEGTYVESQLLIMERHGYREETYYTFSYSPIPRRRRHRRRDHLRQHRRHAARDRRAAARAAARARREDRRGAHVAGGLRAQRGGARLEPVTICRSRWSTSPTPDAGGFVLAGRAASRSAIPPRPRCVPFDSDRAAEAVRCARAARRSASSRAGSRCPGRLPTGGVARAAVAAALRAARVRHARAASGVLVVGLNPFRLFDDAYRDFLCSWAGRSRRASRPPRPTKAERRRAEALAELDRAKTVFFSNVSHEFRTPLTLMLGPLEELLATEAPPRPTSRELEVVHRNALRLLRMVNTVLDFSRAGSGERAGVFRPTDLAPATRRDRRPFEPLVERAGIRLVVDVAALPSRSMSTPRRGSRSSSTWSPTPTSSRSTARSAVTLDSDGGTARLTRLRHGFRRARRTSCRTSSSASTAYGTSRRARTRARASASRSCKSWSSSTAATCPSRASLAKGRRLPFELPFGYEHLPVARVRHEPRALSPGVMTLAYTEEAGRWVGVEPDGVAPDAELDLRATTRDGVAPAGRGRRRQPRHARLHGSSARTATGASKRIRRTDRARRDSRRSSRGRRHRRDDAAPRRVRPASPRFDPILSPLRCRSSSSRRAPARRVRSKVSTRARTTTW